MDFASPIPPLGSNPYPTPTRSSSVSTATVVQTDAFVAGLAPYKSKAGAIATDAGRVAVNARQVDGNLVTVEQRAGGAPVQTFSNSLTAVILSHQTPGSFGGYFPPHPGQLAPTPPSEPERPFLTGSVTAFLNAVLAVLQFIYRFVIIF